MCANDSIQGFALYTGTLPFSKCRYATDRTKDGTKARYDFKWLRIKTDLQAPGSDDDDDDDDQTEGTEGHRKRVKQRKIILHGVLILCMCHRR